VVYSLCSSSFCQGVKVVVVVQKDTHTFFFSRVRDFLLPGFLQTAVLLLWNILLFNEYIVFFNVGLPMELTAEWASVLYFL